MAAVRMLLRAEWRNRWKAWVVCAVLIGLTGGVVLVAAAGARRTDTAYARFLRSSRAGDALVSPEQAVIAHTGFLEALARAPGVAEAAPVVGLSNAFGTSDPRSGVNVIAGLDGRLGRDVDRPKLTSGRMFRPEATREVVTDRPTARQFGWHLGDRVKLRFTPSEQPDVDLSQARRVGVRIVGIGVTRDSVAPVNILGAAPTILAPPGLAGELGDDYVGYSGAVVRLSPGHTVGELRRTAERLSARHLGRSPIFVADEAEQAAKVEHGIRPQAVALALFALLVALTGLFVVGQIVTRQIFVSATDHPVLRMLGMRRSQLVVASLLEAGVAAAAGALLAALVAVVASPTMPIGPARIAEPNPGVEVNWAILGLGALMIVVAVLLRSTWAAWRSTSAPRGVQGTLEPEGADRPARLAERIARAGGPPSLGIGTRLALEPGRGRRAVPVRGATMGATLAIAAVVGAFTFATNLVHVVDTPSLYGQRWDVSLDTQFGRLPRHEVAAFLGQQPGVTGWSFGDHSDAAVDQSHVPGVTLVRGHGRVLAPTIVEGRAPVTNTEIALGTKTLERVHRRVGQMVRVTIGRRHAGMQIVGRAVFPFFGQGSFDPAGLGVGFVAVDADGAAPNFVLVRVAPGLEHDARVAHLVRALGASGFCLADQQCLTLTEQRPADILNYSRIESTPLALAVVLAVLAVAVMAHLLVTSVQRRRRDLAVLKTLGFVRGQVSAAVAWQATTLVALALLVGVPLGLAAGRLVWSAFADGLGVVSAPRTPVLALAILVPAALVVIANAAAAIPARLASRTRPASILRAE